jgi:hypothetical protein
MIPITSRDIPGPDAYNIRDSDVTLKHEPRTVFGSGTRPPLMYVQDIPGPGNYKIPSKGVEGKKFTMSGRYKNSKPDEVPGP